jgi:superoxide reductase
MVELVAGAVDAALEKHVPAVTREDGCIHVNIGSVDHPMTPDHFIQFICLVKAQGYEIHPLQDTDAPATDFYLAEGEEAIAVYEYCNLHGLWKTEL